MEVSGKSLLFLLVALASPSSGVTTLHAKPANPWARAAGPSQGKAASIGAYNAGCVAGAKALPDSGKGFQLARPSRGRTHGHPALVAFVQDLGGKVSSAKAGVLMIGDLGQSRGGPSPSGHSSHQSGLDADIWFWHPKSATKKVLPRKTRERLGAKEMVSRKTKKRTRHWSAKVSKVLKLAASDDRVARIFVNPIIKKELCKLTRKQTAEQRTWLAKLRPWWGHNAHFHVRLACPKGSTECVDQEPVGSGDGCAEIDWWLDDKAQADRKKKRKKYRSTIGTLPELPESCAALIK